MLLMLRTIAVVILAVLLHAPAATAQRDSFSRCLDALHTSRRARSISAATWANVANVRPDSAVLEQLNAQPEFTLPVWDYLAVMVDSERVLDGQRYLRDCVAIRRGR
jgi:membrane-bound lytic murein transglycosylase B